MVSTTMTLLSFITFAVALASTASALSPVPYEEFKRAGVAEDVVRKRLENRAARCTLNETFPAPTIPSVYDLVKRDSFVTRKGTQLYLLGEPFRMTGVNVGYTLGTSSDASDAY